LTLRRVSPIYDGRPIDGRVGAHSCFPLPCVQSLHRSSATYVSRARALTATSPRRSARKAALRFHDLPWCYEDRRSPSTNAVLRDSCSATVGRVMSDDINPRRMRFTPCKRCLLADEYQDYAVLPRRSLPKCLVLSLSSTGLASTSCPDITRTQ
jgi:hypothetical protein